MLYIIANPLAGGGKGAKCLAKTEAILAERKVPYTVLISNYASQSVEHGKRCATDINCTVIAVLGGDGTFNEVINGLAGCKKPIGFIPAGTGNDFCRTAGLPNDPAAAIDVILGGKTRPIDVLFAGDRLCLNVYGTGLDVEILARAIKYRRFFKGKLSYYLALIVSLIVFKFRTFTYTVDGNTFVKQAMMVSICNGRFCGGGLPVAPEASIEDGLIDFVIIKKVNRLTLPYLLMRFLQGRLPELKCAEFYRCREISVDVSPSLPFNCDGELIPFRPITITIHPAELNMLCP